MAKQWAFKRRNQPVRVDRAVSLQRPLYSLECCDTNANNNSLPILRCFKIECFQNLPCLLDTGASKSLIREDIFKRFLPSVKNRVSRCQNTLTSVTGHKLTILGECPLKFSAGDKEITVTVIICKQLPFPCILGVDAIRKYGIVWEPISNTITINQANENNRQICVTTNNESEDSNYNLKISGKITIEGGTTAQVLATLNAKEGKVKTMDAMIGGYTIKEYPMIFVENQVIKIENGITYLKLSNLSNNKIKLNQIEIGSVEKNSN